MSAIGYDVVGKNRGLCGNGGWAYGTSTNDTEVSVREEKETEGQMEQVLCTFVLPWENSRYIEFQDALLF